MISTTDNERNQEPRGAVAPSAPRVVVRRMAWRDFPRVFQMAREVPGCPGLERDLRSVLQSSQTLGCVAEVRRELAGFALCTLAGPAGGRRWWKSVARLLWPLGGRLPRPPHLNLVEVVVAPSWPRPEVERALLEELDRQVRHAGPGIQIAVPETDLTAQLFLREAGYRATRVLREHYGREDGYLMVR